MAPRNPAPDQPWLRAYEAILAEGKTYGDALPLDWLLGHMELVRPEKCATGLEAQKMRVRILRNTERLKRELLERENMALRSIPGDGYDIVVPEEQTSWAMEDAQEEIRRALRKVSRRVSFVAVDRLTDEAKRENINALAKLSAFRPTVRKSLALVPDKTL